MSASEAKAAIVGYRCDVALGPGANSTPSTQVASAIHRSR